MTAKDQRITIDPLLEDSSVQVVLESKPKSKFPLKTRNDVVTQV